jgi:hypothetical protein
MVRKHGSEGAARTHGAIDRNNVRESVRSQCEERNEAAIRFINRAMLIVAKYFATVSYVKTNTKNKRQAIVRESTPRGEHMIVQNRSDVDQCLNDTATTIFMLIGPEGSKAGTVHNFMAGKYWEPFRCLLLLPDASLLTTIELDDWFSGQTSQYYVVLGGSTLPKRVAKRGPVTELLKNDSEGTPNYLKIVDIFLMGDQI